jgi:hypothetical protein
VIWAILFGIICLTGWIICVRRNCQLIDMAIELQAEVEQLHSERSEMVFLIRELQGVEELPGDEWKRLP